MPLFRYYLSRDVHDPSPPTKELLSIEAASTNDAIDRLLNSGRLPPDWRTIWAHFLIWTGEEGSQRGFESIWLGDWKPPRH